MDFQYVARAKDGTIVKDVASGPSVKSVADGLRAQGLTPTSVKELKKAFDFKSLLKKVSRVKLIDKITFIKNLGVMIKAGLPVSKSLKILADQTVNKKFASVIQDISRQVEGGTSLAEALGKHPDIFSNIFISMVKVGEVSGNLEQNLGYLSEQMSRDYQLISKAKGAMTYPMVVMVALLGVGFAMFTFVLPKLTAVFTEANVELPFLTRVIIGMVDFFASYGLLSLPVILALVGAFMYWKKTEPGKAFTHKAAIVIPVIGPIVKKVNLARFIGVFSSLLKSGMPIVDSLTVASDVIGNIYYKKIAMEAASKVKVGSQLAATFKKYPKMFEPLVVQMMEVGEESGTTDVILSEVARFYEAEVDETMKNLSSILEPMIMMIIGVVVGFLAVGLVQPIYSITQSV